eukprot:3369410-Alexandrium_andersonii.AAC.1
MQCSADNALCNQRQATERRPSTPPKAHTTPTGKAWAVGKQARKCRPDARESSAGIFRKTPPIAS